MPGDLLGVEAPSFKANTTIGRIHVTPVCTTELGRAAKLAPEFTKRTVKMISLSIDSVEDHLAWSKDVNAYKSEDPTEQLPFPIIDDKNQDFTIQLGMLDPAEKDEKGMPVTARVVFIFGPGKKLKLSILYPATTGRNFDEILRVIICLQLTAEKRVAIPVDQKNGDSVMVLPTIPEEKAKNLFPKGAFIKELPSGKKYFRPAIDSPQSWFWSCPLSTMSQRMPAVHHGFPQQSIKNILV
ncbi:hypothetical protein FD755_021716 [Muntiacus reevesi]|uniref:Alkyl hydroperoxide reductase subunit C/ Thiol specific antioxidant domain-containing protein n=1 Tax=Muntiacus reevesi TaxID=9886 RepID=A0A5N3W3E0_MUNRE|nr:hypothetical protein FD755_021716 [Muntiacus reevesi]